MELIERYLQEVGRALPRSKQADILTELRSSLYDELERDDGAPSEAEVLAAITAMGPPQQVAAAYYPSGQYLIGPTLYPVFRLVLGIVFCAVVGAQLLVVLLALTLKGGAALDGFWDIISSLPAALGSVVAVFWLLQRLDVQPKLARSFDPRKLPPLDKAVDKVSRGEQAFSIVVAVVAMVLVTYFARRGGFAGGSGTSLLENPVLDQYVAWLVLPLLLSTMLDIFVLWRGVWQTSTRIASIITNLFSLIVAYLLLQAHTAWLERAGSATGFVGLFKVDLADAPNTQVAGMLLFRMGFAFAVVIIFVQLAFDCYRLWRSRRRQGLKPNALLTTISG